MPAEMRGDWPRISQSSKKWTMLLSSPPTNEWCLPAPSVIKPEEREFVVDSGASMHMLSRKDLNSAELETVRVSKSPTTVCGSQWRSVNKRRSDSVCQRIGFIRDSKGFSKKRRPFLSLGKLCEDHGYCLPLDQWSETTTHQRWQTDKVQHCELHTNRCHWFHRQALQAQLHLRLQHQYRRKQ